MAGTIRLKPPPADIDSRELDIALVSPTSLLRVSRHDTGEPHFGRTGDCRFDDAQTDVGKRVGTCYLGFNLTAAFAESVLHNLEPEADGFSIPATEVSSRFAVCFKGSPVYMQNINLKYRDRLCGFSLPMNNRSP